MSCNSYCSVTHLCTCDCTCSRCVPCPPTIAEEGCPSITYMECVKSEADFDENCLEITNADTLYEMMEKLIEAICDLQDGAGDKYVRISSLDTTSGYLSSKLKKKSGSPLTLTIKNSGLNEYLEIDINTTGIPGTTLIANDSSTIDFTQSGTGGHTITAAAKISATSGNILSDSSGLYATDTSLSVTDSSTIDFTASGTKNHTLTASVKIKSGSNELVDSTGLYVAPFTANNGMKRDGQNFELGDPLVRDTTIAGAYDLILSEGQLGIGITPTVPLHVSTTSLVAGGIVSNSKDFDNGGMGGLGVEGLYTQNNSSLYTGTANAAFAGVGGVMLFNATADNDLKANVPYCGTLGSLQTSSGAGYDIIGAGIPSSFGSSIILTGAGSFNNLASLYITTPKEGGTQWTGTINGTLYDIVIEGGSSLSHGTVTARGGIYQKSNDANIFTGSSRFTNGIKTESKAGNPTTSDIPDGYWGVWKNTSTGDIKIFANNGGTMVSSIALT